MTRDIRIKTIYLRSWWRAALSRVLPIEPTKAVRINEPFVWSSCDPMKGVACLGGHGRALIETKTGAIEIVHYHGSRLVGVEVDTAPPAGKAIRMGGRAA